ncbi:MAG: hypothetical protein LV481_05815 [Methylacidiphilales bacterium]|nr:hypothetical protein [Candidatus Methylacidiphilales bacterium]
MQSVRVCSLAHCALLPVRGNQKYPLARTSLPAFTLVEVAIALGVFSFAIIGILGMMMTGLATAHKSMDFNTETAISQQLSGEAEVLNYSMITNTGSSYRENFELGRYFDVFGQELTNIPTPTSYVYEATLTVTNAYVPGTSTSSSVAQELIFQITSPHLTGSTNSYYLWEVDNGR